MPGPILERCLGRGGVVVTNPSRKDKKKKETTTGGGRRASRNASLACGCRTTTSRTDATQKQGPPRCWLGFRWALGRCQLFRASFPPPRGTQSPHATESSLGTTFPQPREVALQIYVVCCLRLFYAVLAKKDEEGENKSFSPFLSLFLIFCAPSLPSSAPVSTYVYTLYTLPAPLCKQQSERLSSSSPSLRPYPPATTTQAHYIRWSRSRAQTLTRNIQQENRRSLNVRSSPKILALWIPRGSSRVPFN